MPSENPRDGKLVRKLAEASGVSTQQIYRNAKQMREAMGLEF